MKKIIPIIVIVIVTMICLSTLQGIIFGESFYENQNEIDLAKHENIKIEIKKGYNLTNNILKAEKLWYIETYPRFLGEKENFWINSSEILIGYELSLIHI